MEQVWLILYRGDVWSIVVSFYGAIHNYSSTGSALAASAMGSSEAALGSSDAALGSSEAALGSSEAALGSSLTSATGSTEAALGSSTTSSISAEGALRSDGQQLDLVPHSLAETSSKFSTRSGTSSSSSSAPLSAIPTPADP